MAIGKELRKCPSTKEAPLTSMVSSFLFVPLAQVQEKHKLTRNSQQLTSAVEWALNSTGPASDAKKTLNQVFCPLSDLTSAGRTITSP
mmetsp:Transcript_23363/g.42241  ORF Transcript_23363/g.42241 Transcript_23363/m.42241 type:complete len:88 (+) Transcript_23363:87-350(+)